jgi:hypothetical protein
MVGRRRTTRRRPDIWSSSGETTHNPALIPQEAAGSTPHVPANRRILATARAGRTGQRSFRRPTPAVGLRAWRFHMVSMKPPSMT